jgi:hypothetical protein
MKRIEIVGMSLVAMVAVAAMMAPGAQAAEVVSCVKSSKVPIEYEKNGKKKTKLIHEGQYKNRKCTELAPEKTGKYPGYEGPEGKFQKGAVGARFTPASGTFRLKPKLELANGQVVQCASSAGTGEWTSSKTGTETVVWQECALVTEDVKGESCTSAGWPPGQIETSPLVLRLISYPEELPGDVSYEEGKVFVDSSVAAGYTYYTEFACGPTASFRLLGNVAGAVKSKLNVPGKKIIWYNGPGEGAQDLSAEYSSDGGVSYAPFGGAEESYEVRASDDAGLEVIEPL